LAYLSDHYHPVSIHYDSHNCSQIYKAGLQIAQNHKRERGSVDRQGKQEFFVSFFTPLTGWPDVFNSVSIVRMYVIDGDAIHWK